ncbi:MAG TPA: tRNA (adenosine(37)-N6)-threonylcarbamoyltransferase complex ATPase subunit type 1 TsaE [Pyrinomonadaceae bacterium]|nr:tRNA (adenosine(37)-N6)-threonylcarbamoyltransferase complex ATPase subunit type 1 TsaE [Pyrinomonadaceae bacterium]
MNSETKTKDQRPKTYICNTPQDTFDLGEKLGESLIGGEVILLEGGLGAGKTLLTKGILYGLDFDVDEVTSPSFTLVNRYDAKFTVYHLDLWRIEQDAAFAVGLDEILEDENAVVIIEWSERLQNFSFPKKLIRVKIEGDGDDARQISIS